MAAKKDTWETFAKQYDSIITVELSLFVDE